MQEIQSGDEAVLTTVMKKLDSIDNMLTMIKQLHTKCGILGNWRRIAFLNTAESGVCPAGLRTVTNTVTNQRACGRTVNLGCTSLQFPSGDNYTNVCGKVRGYQYGDTELFNPVSIDSAYLTGLSVTHGSPRHHLWSFVVGDSEQHRIKHCPCARSEPNHKSGVPLFVGEHFYCESGFSGRNDEKRIAWEDPLWDGEGCTIAGNKCCERYGWFHRDIPPTTDNIEVRWCGNHPRTNEDVYTDLVEIWVN
jgi:hypothetical protein